ncbi:hypothetical protein SAMD00019534_114850 [Acytostelium subglobosum LB1]|uniref:hypothetical protein n=1 Tax=Acytostelium subglobosum LB1 TaxID=1410327 RepID=UPI0006450F17|nr:hypothetical protein SAMD00019534_114850 [Acytostelium subglobosum LB1]GAM28309.1 hypothetical protein SAMD00019534_114850 [Acytostelium subglobosum LB1]|eukprot:XP_012748626.1 hypothetical protein SAMD00019534_114850 [Acytostelium subglobosum LB1]
MCTSIDTLKVNINISPLEDGPKVEGGGGIISRLGPLIIPQNVKILVLKINASLQTIKGYIWKVLSDNPHIINFHVATNSNEFDVRCLDERRELAICVCKIEDTCDDTTSKMTFFRLDHFLNSDINTTFKTFDPFFDDSKLYEPDEYDDYEDDDDDDYDEGDDEDVVFNQTLINHQQ